MTKKSIIFTLFGITVAICAIAGPIVWNIYKDEIKSVFPKKNETENLQSEGVKNDEIFPKWDIGSLDNFTKYKENKVILDEEIISFFISETLKRMSTSNGQLEYSYKFSHDLKCVDIFLKWSLKEKVKRKTYTIFIDGL